MNMLLHGINNADLQNDDTLATPKHDEPNGELTRFDRVITNPPFSQNYHEEGMQHKERFALRVGPETGKKADLMFAQHILAVLEDDGLGATVMPHGVLFRGGKERDIRKRIIEEDRLDAVIGLAPNLFYGTGIPACVLVLRGPGPRRADRRGKVLFVNADREFTAGRAQNFLRPEAHREDRHRLQGLHGRRRPRPRRFRGGTGRERLQPQHPPLRRQHSSARTAGRPRPPARRDAGGGGRAIMRPSSPRMASRWPSFSIPPNVPGTSLSPNPAGSPWRTKSRP